MARVGALEEELDQVKRELKGLGMRDKCKIGIVSGRYLGISCLVV